jgi:hypothetical protein
MPRVPLNRPYWSSSCDPRLPQAALAFRIGSAPQLTTATYLSQINVTAWLYRDENGNEAIKVNPNIRIQEIIKRFGRAESPDAEIGIHSEGIAAQWFRDQLREQDLEVLQIFSERIPCKKMCGPMLDHYFPGVPWYYYYGRDTWYGPGGRVERRAGDVLKTVYGL